VISANISANISEIQSAVVLILVGISIHSLLITSGLRAIQYAVALNLVGVVKVLAGMAHASLAGTLHWAVNAKAHGTLRELLVLGAEGGAVGGEWGGCSPLMLAAEQVVVMNCDNY